ncbi:8-oxo-dGTP diphosphatase [Saliniradius amylolyticus]|uniref:8-oxo-dGTP diphosphatase n=1 Tax=Saliniradius amylolyticus TaxID=2183582 RepID=A0A2S2E5K5_9ALTE|nr:8-oxo-dGTP diphosphatase MutT [Saliniradius amylolyticus]AWL12913.1 8-oxo-dGTP diphosphatase [Saliniradius amylolyticus]
MLVEVAVGVIQRGDAVFITRRSAQQHQGDKWEFPGGKVEAGETADSALVRELAEEVGITAHRPEPLMVIEHDYGDKAVRLRIFHVTEFEGQPYGREDQPGTWASIASLEDYAFPEANSPILERLKSLSLANS